MLNPTFFLALIIGAVLTFGGGAYFGHDLAVTKYEAQQAQDLKKQKEVEDDLRARGDILADNLAKAEAKIVTRTVEVIKYVPKYTTGAPCLSAAAVDGLQPGGGQGLRQPAGKPDAEDAVATAADQPERYATDTDIAYWIAEANQSYETCALRLSGLIDFEHQRVP